MSEIPSDDQLNWYLESGISDGSYEDRDFESVVIIQSDQSTEQSLFQRPIEQFPQRSISRKKIMNGTGREYAKIPKWIRSYDLETSPVYRQLRIHNSTSMISVDVLKDLIIAIQTSSPENNRPTPPTRAKKRLKKGLIVWLDQNAVAVFKYLEHSRTNSSRIAS
jgi:hypothetical protein